MSYPNVDKVIERALYYHHLYIIDGDPRGNKLIGERIIVDAGLAPDPNYFNKKFAWCGYTQMACFHYAGYNLNLGSVGKVLYGTGMYNKMENGAAAFADWPNYVLIDGKKILIEDYHKQKGQMRIVSKDIKSVQRGDILLNQNDEGGKPFNGHVMLCIGNTPEIQTIFTIEGNAHGFMPPKDGKIEFREGIVTKSYKYGDKYLEYWVRPSPLDLGMKFYNK